MFTIIALIAVALTIAMFVTKNMLLGWPSFIFWFIYSAGSYSISTRDWADPYYWYFWAGLGMALFSMLSMFALKQRDIEPKESDYEDSEPMLDEGGKTEPDELDADPKQGEYYGEDNHQSRRLSELRNRVAKRRQNVRGG